MQSNSSRQVDPKLQDDIRRAWLISIGDLMLNNQTEKAIQMAKSSDLVLDFVASYLHSRGCSLVYLNGVGPAENSQTYVSPDSYDSGQRNFSTVPSINQHTSEQTLNNNPFKNAMSMKKVKTEIVDDNFNQFGSSTSNQIDDDILFLSNELSKVVPKEEKPADVSQDSQNVLLLCDKPYKLDLEDFNVIDYCEWTILQIIKDLEMNADLTGAENLIVMINPKWLNRGVMDVLQELDQLCESINQKWPKLRIRLIGLVEDGSNDSIGKFNYGLEQNCALHGNSVVFEDLNNYLESLLPNSRNRGNDFTETHLAGFLKQLD